MSLSIYRDYFPITNNPESLFIALSKLVSCATIGGFL